MIYRPYNEAPLEQKVSNLTALPDSIWHWDEDKGYLLIDGGPQSVKVVPLFPISDN